MDPHAVVVLSTVGNGDDAKRLAHSFVEARLAACVNILGPIKSVYRWEGRIMEDGEHLLVIKTESDRIEELRDLLLENHPYDVPEFVVLPIEATSTDYGSWIFESTRRHD